MTAFGIYLWMWLVGAMLFRSIRLEIGKIAADIVHGYRARMAELERKP